MNKHKKLTALGIQGPALIQSLSHDGRGITTHLNKKTFVSGALPDENVTYQLTRKRSSYNEGTSVEIINTSVKRATPPCHHFGLCGGCSLQHMIMQTQLELKQETLLNHLKHFGGVLPDSVLPALTASTVGYRRKARLGVKFVTKKNKLLIGFREKAGRYLADLNHCAVLHPKIGECFNELSELISSLLIFDQIPQIEFAMGDKEAALIFRHLVAFKSSDLEKLISFGKRYGFHLYLQPNQPQAITKLWPNDGRERLTYTLAEEKLEFLFYPLDFTQINLEMNRLMVQQALHLLAPAQNETVLDLFCGIGNFSLPIARRARSVVGIEGSEEMVNRARENARHNQLNNTTFYAADLTKISEASWITAYDKVLLDPPRTGAKEILPSLGQIDAKKIVYVSCNPATLARDAGSLVNDYHYTFSCVGVMNMFPHTTHVEAIAVFEKK